LDQLRHRVPTDSLLIAPKLPLSGDRQRPTNFAATEINKIERGPLSLQKSEGRPHGHEVCDEKRKFSSIKEIASRYGISDWTLYRFIKIDPSFPYLNVGIKKKFVINEDAFRAWMEDRTKKERNHYFHLPTGEELLKRRGE